MFTTEELQELLKIIKGSKYKGKLTLSIYNKIIDKLNTIVGRLYSPYDNSWCINCHTGQDTLIVQRDTTVGEYIGPHKEEEGASFIIVSEPYEELVSDIFSSVGNKRIFIKVKSLLTGNVYRTLFNENYIL